ncbi:MAG: substrate-binding domain-containing protein [Anaerolineales bacterium]
MKTHRFHSWIVFRRRSLSNALVALLLVSLAACQARLAAAPAAPLDSAEQSGSLSVSGAFALYPLMIAWAEDYQAQHPQVRIDVSAGGAGKGMADTLSGAVDIGMVSRDITPEEQARGAYWLAVATDAVFPTASDQNPVLPALMARGVTAETFAGIYISGQISTWGQVAGLADNQDAVHVYTRSDAAGAPEVWARFLGGNRQEDLLGIGVFGDPGILEAVIKDPLGIGFNNLNYAFDAGSGLPVTGAVVLPVDVNANGQADPQEILDSKEKAVTAVAEGRYPSPPARNLNLVTNGKPSGLTRDFLVWILSGGQSLVSEVGYIPIPDERLAAQLAEIR